MTQADRRPRLLIASYAGDQRGFPRSDRTRMLQERLADRWEVELLAGPHPSLEKAGRRTAGRLKPRLRRMAGRLRDQVLIDKFEPWVTRRMRGWSVDADAALLIGPPFSLLAAVAPRLSAEGIPYVVDVGDPWVLTSPHRPRKISARRALRREQLLWANAAGAIVTTQPQGDALSRLFPELPILVRPNGYPDLPGLSDPPPRRGASRRSLELAHFGHFYAQRVPVQPFFDALVGSGLWESVILHQYGSDWDGLLEPVRSRIDVVDHDPVAWEEAVRAVAAYDAVLAVGNERGVQLPSKIIQYLTLPSPRIALVDDPEEDCIATYLADKPGWLVCGSSDSAVPGKVLEHTTRRWEPEELAPPPGESWGQVADEVGAFLAQVVTGERPGALAR